MATPAQKEIIKQSLTEEQLARAIRAYGPHFERMTAEDAGKTLQTINRSKAS